MKKFFLVVVGLLTLTLLSACIDLISDGVKTLQLREGIDTVEINSNWIDQGAFLLVDNIEIEALSSHQVDTKVIGSYQVEYELNHEDKIYKVIRIVTVVDQIAPMITLNPGVDSIKRGQTWIDAFVTVEDNSLSTVTVLVTGFVNTEEVGQYQITYTATDESGNSSSMIRVVTVYE